MKVLITGVAGFIGSSLAQAILQDERWEVLGIDSFSPYYDLSLKRRNVRSLGGERFSLIEGDIASLALPEVLDGVEVVFHLAGQPGVRGSWGSGFDQYVQNNVVATQRLLEASRDSRSLHRFVYASSSSIYGEAESYPTAETDTPAPMSPYGVTKLAAEHMVSLYAKNFGLPTVSLRFFTVYGPRQRPDMAFNKFIRAGLGMQPIYVYGDGSQVREFTHVSDIVRANIAAAQVEIEGGQVINLSGGASVSVNEVLSTLSGQLGRTLDVRYTNVVAGDVTRTGGSTRLARQLLGWEPRVRLAAGLRSEVDWIKSEDGNRGDAPDELPAT